MAYIESVSDATNDIEQTENNKQCFKCKLSLQQVLLSFGMSCSLIISAESTA